MTVASPRQGASFDAFQFHPGYRRMFAPDELTIGIFLPLSPYQGRMEPLLEQTATIREIDRLDFAALWVRDVPLADPSFGDVGQVFDPFNYLAFLAAQTQRISLATGSAIFSLRHPLDLAKNAATVDQLSGGRLVLGVASGDQPIEFPAYGLDHARRAARFAQAIDDFRHLLQAQTRHLDSPLGRFSNAELLPKPYASGIPLMITGACGQSPEWIAVHADGWLTYPDATHTPQGPQRLAAKIQAWRQAVPDGGFRPHITNEWLDLTDDPNYPRTPQRGGFVLRTGRKGLLALLEEWRAAGVNHAALGLQHGTRPAAQVLQELAEEVLPHFPSHSGATG